MTKQVIAKKIFIIFCPFILFLTSCDKDDEIDSSVISQLIVSPDILILNDSDTGKLLISIQPTRNFQWEIATKPEWLAINPTSGNITNQIIELEIIPITTGMEAGTYTGEIEIITNGAGKAETNIQLEVAPHPKTEIEPESIKISAGETEKKFTIRNAGTGYLTWELDSIPEWIEFNIQSGTLGAGNSIELTAIPNISQLEVGTVNGFLIVATNSEEGDVTIDIELEVPALPILTIEDSELNFNYFDETKSFYIKNTGNVSFNWSINNSDEYLSLSTLSGSLNHNDSIEVSVNIDRSNLDLNEYNTVITIENENDQAIDLPVTINHYSEEKWLIDEIIIDAEYDRINDVIISVSESPNQISKYNPVTKEITNLELKITPNCLAISLDGNFAAVGHDGYFTYVDLSTMQIAKTYAVTTDALDIILAPNNWVYVSPKGSSWDRIRCIDLTTGNEIESTGNLIHGGTKIKLHPSGDYIYGADNGLSPSDFEKYDITEGTANYLYDSPYHGDYSFNGDIWISEDGYRLFSKAKNVFNSSSNKDNDMTYSGKLVGEGNIITLDYSQNAEQIFAIISENAWDNQSNNLIRKYEAEYLAFQGTIELPGFLIPDGSGGGTIYNSEGFYGFFNSSGSEYYVLIKAENGSGLLKPWAIVTIQVD